MPKRLNDSGLLPESLRLPRGHLPRPRLRDALLEAECRLRLLCAPAGSGKSVILSECAQQCPAGTRLVYLDLRGQPLSPEAWLQRLAFALGADSADQAGIRQYLEDHEQPLWLLLDNYPRFPDSELDTLLNDLIVSAPRRIHWWLASRRRPQLQLARLLLEGELFELDGSELAFTESEVADLVQIGGHHWPRPEVQALQKASQGWCAGIRLRLLGLQPGQPPQTERNDVLLLDYLKREVLNELPNDWQHALYSLAQLQEFDAALCEQLLGVGEGAHLLGQLTECGLFIESASEDGKHFRVFTVVAPLLASLLPVTMASALFRKACQWCVSQGQVRSALEYALKAGQPEVAANLMQHYTRDRMLQGRSLALLTQWCSELPESLLASTPRLVLLNAWTQLLCGRLDEAQEHANRLARFMPQPDAQHQQELIAQWKALVANLAFHRGAAEQSRPLLREAIDELPRRAWGQRLFCCALQIEQALIEGRFDEAQELNRQAIKQSREQASLAMESFFALSHVKLLEIRGELLRAETLLKHLYSELNAAWSAEASPMRARVQLRRAALLLQQGRYQEAEASFKSGLQDCLDCVDPAAFWGHLGLAELDALHGDLAGAFSRIADAERLMHFGHISVPLYQGLLLRAKARLWLIQGRAAQAEKALRNLSAEAIHFSPYGMPDLNLRLRLLLLQAQLANGAIVETVDALGAMRRQALEEGRRPLACEVGFSLAEGLYAANRQEHAKQVMLDALSMARQMGLASAERDFALRNPAMMRWAGKAGSHDSVPATLLTPRERDVLKLIAQGYSNQQIADALFISLHTVKTHAQRINCKLGVERRTQAVVRAKELGLAG
ncbi:helix-turn-helix transcriptional regulator [Pseudomonas cavernicola]|uniref:Helix-turn-helix transcriptional regulator n=1 Tax=Pseudomonas cavernicola TaxID=2320866 RepID=A0A418XEU7_9PSED|nr:LuxR C-terminal-related transcriptional regulator [Pseudomonas cavernicola]RJG10873.1 helix-turn-helix transcriptional regulator [Pseudomonas cavernicola]